MPNTMQRMERWEGRKNIAYPDPLTHGDPWTIGIGHAGSDVYEGLVWADAKIDSTFASDWQHAQDQCLNHFPWMKQLDEVRQFVFTAMCFQMGIVGLMGFVQTLAAARDGHYAHAAALMLDSLWAHQTPGRAAAMSRQLETGQYQ